MSVKRNIEKELEYLRVDNSLLLNKNADNSPGTTIPLDAIKNRQVDTRSLNSKHVTALLESITALGLIEPIVVDEKFRLLAGAHRLAAIRLLKQERIDAYNKHFPEDAIPVRIMPFDAEVDLKKALQCEVAENEHRRDYTPKEVRQLAERLKELGYLSTRGRCREGEKHLVPALQVIVGKSRATLMRYLAENDNKSNVSNETFSQPRKKLKKLQKDLKTLQKFKITGDELPTVLELNQQLPKFMKLIAYDLCIHKITPEQRASLDLSSWEIAFTGAEPVRAETLEKFAETFKTCGFCREAFYPCYGMAETTLFVTGGLKHTFPVIHQVSGTALEQNRIVDSTDEDSNMRKIVSCGQTWLDMNVVIVEPKSLTKCEGDRIGEIWVSGSSVAQGYWNRPLETKQTFHAYLADTKEGPFLRTGDLGFIRDNELFVTGRLKDVIIIRGQNYYPQDIEHTVEKSHPALRPGCSAAFAVEVKGSERLVIVQEVERSYLRKLNMNEIVGSFREAVTAEHGLQVYATVLVKPGSIPKTSSGKIQRHACRAKFLNGSLNVVEDWSENPQYKSEFIHLQAEIESVFQKLPTGKQIS